VVPGAIALALIAAGLLLPLVQWTVPANAPLTVRLLQGNVKQEMKFEESGMRAAIDQYQQMITSKPADLIVTPETAIPVLAQQLPAPFASAVRNFSDTTGSAILFGAIGGTITPEGQVIDYTNSLFGVTPGTRDVYRYDKHHLVPFGEFVPWGFRWFVNLMSIPLGDFYRGAPVQKPFIVHNQPVAVDICYEDIFGEEIARTIRESDTPGDTIALDQHLQIARMRSLETGRPMLRATNTGMTAAIDADGKVLGRLTPYTVGSLDLTVQGTSGSTPYVTSGNNTVLAVSLFLLAFGFAFGPGIRRRQNGKQ
jgi:apolipoprotein N-acyltransferase